MFSQTQSELSEETRKKIEALIAKENFVLFMKGTPNFPKCGFSARAVAILTRLEIPFHSFDVLTDDDIRHGIKTYSNWMTIPQLYCKGELVGGSDIMLEMFESGELAEMAKGVQ